MELIKKIQAFLEGKKTYIVAIIGGILGLLTAYGIVIPEYVYVILGALGLGTLRSAVGK